MRSCVLYKVFIIQHFIFATVFIFRFLVFKKNTYGYLPKLLKKKLTLKKERPSYSKKKKMMVILFKILLLSICCPF